MEEGRITLTDGIVERQRIERLEAALRSVIQTWENPGPMGTLYQMPRAIDYAKFVLNGPPAYSQTTEGPDLSQAERS